MGEVSWGVSSLHCLGRGFSSSSPPPQPPQHLYAFSAVTCIQAKRQVSARSFPSHTSCPSEGFCHHGLASHQTDYHWNNAFTGSSFKVTLRPPAMPACHHFLFLAMPLRLLFIFLCRSWEAINRAIMPGLDDTPRHASLREERALSQSFHCSSPFLIVEATLPRSAIFPAIFHAAAYYVIIRRRAMLYVFQTCLRIHCQGHMER